MTDARATLPNEFVLQMEKILGEEAPAFFASLNQPATLALRLNPARLEATQAAQAFIDAPVPWAPYGWYLRADTKPGASIAHAAGAFYLQEASAMVSVAVLRPRPGERVLDLCAAPGGKSTQIADALEGQGLLVANEPVQSRARILASNLERMGARNAVVTCAYPDMLAARWAEYFDAVLCDAPCSGEGMFRRDPAARAQWNPTTPAGCAKRQAEILDSAAELVRPGGRLVYSTCTFNKIENEDTLAAFLDRHPDFSLEAFALPGLGPSQGGTIRIWPHRTRGDGHFAAKLRKSGDDKSFIPSSNRAGREIVEELRKLETEIGPLPEVLTRRVEHIGSCTYAVSPECPELAGVHIISPGVHLLRAGKNYIKPEHALAMALDAKIASQCMELDDMQARRFLAGEVLACEMERRGWTLICWRGMPLGWGKASNGQMKNHLPKGLRLRGNRAD